ncbi:MAG: hypothetical protein MUW57_16925 [Pseudomonas sp.]|nr:hypothetical protein [Pseudomonas sp.]
MTRGYQYSGLLSLGLCLGAKHRITGYRHRRSLSFADDSGRGLNVHFKYGLAAAHQVIDWELIPVVFDISKTPHTQLPSTTEQYRQAPVCLENTARHGDSD